MGRSNQRYAVKFRRRRANITNYKKRLKLLQSKLPRLVIRKSDRQIIVQIVEFAEKGDKTIALASSSELKGLGWGFGLKSTPAAYLTGLLAARKAKEKKVAKAIADIGLYVPTKGAKVFAALKGAVDGGLQVPHNPDVLPSEERIAGRHM